MHKSITLLIVGLWLTTAGATAKRQFHQSYWSIYNNPGTAALEEEHYTEAEKRFDEAARHYDENRHLEEPLTIFAVALLKYKISEFETCQLKLKQATAI